MGIVSKLFGDDAANRSKTSNGHERDYIDLSDYSATEKVSGAESAASTYVKFAQVRALEDLKHFASYVYDGNILVLDIKAVQSDEILLRRLSNELRKLAQDTGGDLAGLGDSHIMLTPTGIKVDRRPMTVNKDDVAAAEAPRRPATSTTPASASPASPPALNARGASASSASPPARTNGRRPQ